MSLTNCKKCGRMFNTMGTIKICSRCRETDDEMFQAVKEFVYSNPGADISEVSEAVDVPEKKILKFLREGKLQTTGHSMLIECVTCGEPIQSGKYCEKCTRQMTTGLKEAAKKIQEHIEPKEMRTVGKGMHIKKK